MLRMLTTVLAATLLAGPAMARDTFSIGADLGGAARYIDNEAFTDPDGFGLNVGLRSELNLLAHIKADLRYVEGRAFDPSEHRFLDLSASASSPALLILCLDVHELYYRQTSRPGDGLFYVNSGLGLKGRFAGNSLKASLGFSYISGEDTAAASREQALGAYVGFEHMLRIKWVDTNLRAAWFIALNQPGSQMGLLIDGDLTLKFPVGSAFLGPRFDVAYRNLGLSGGTGLFGQTQEMTASVGLAVHWGTGGR